MDCFRRVGLPRNLCLGDVPFCSPVKESKKVVITSDRAKALGRCKVHVLPILGSVTILTLNLRGTWFGADLAWAFRSETMTLMGFQILAKIQEVFMIVSLSIIVFQVVRHELIHGSGLPLGLIGSGITIGNPGVFFTHEFWGSMTTAKGSNRLPRRIGLVLFLCLVGIVAALAGPSAATLLIPTNQEWPSGGTQFYLNGTSEELWASDLSGDMAELGNYCGNGTSRSLSICPAGGFLSLYEHWSRMSYTNFYDRDVAPYAKNLSGSRFYWPVHSPNSPTPPLFALGDARMTRNLGDYTFLAQPHAATATLSQHLAADWWTAARSKFKSAESQVGGRAIKTTAKAAITSMRCADPQDLSAIENTVRFPVIQGRFDYGEAAEFAVQALNATPSDHLRFQWVHLPEEFGTVSIGAVFETPWSPTKTSRAVIGCSAQMGWVPAVLATDEYTFWSGWYPYDIKFGGRTPWWTQTPPGVALAPTNGRVAIGDAWLKLLTPAAATSSANWNPSTIEAIFEAGQLVEDLVPRRNETLAEAWILSEGPSPDRTGFLEAIICSVLVDGLSRTGNYRAFTHDDFPADWALALYEPLPEFDKLILGGKNALAQPGGRNDSITTLQVKMAISGFCIRRSLQGLLSMTPLLVHIILAMMHVLWVAHQTHTSSSWENISELIALAQNSEPAYTALANTGGGIRRRQTFGRMAKIRARPALGVPGEERVELIFEDDLERHGPIMSSRPTYSQDSSTTQGSNTGTGALEHVGSGDIAQTTATARQQYELRSQRTSPKGPRDGLPRETTTPQDTNPALDVATTSPSSSVDSLLSSHMQASQKPPNERPIHVGQAYC